MGAGPREQSSPSLAHPSSAYKLQAQVWEALLLSTKASRMVMILGYWDIRGLPYLIDGAHKVTQSNAILRYIARKHNLCGETEEEKIRVDILENEVTDTRMAFAMLCYNPDFEKLRPGYLEGLPDKLKLYSQFLGKRPWFAGEKLTYVDFLVYDLLDLHRIFEPKSLEAFPNLKEFMTRFEGLKKISAYMKSGRFLPGPLFLKIAVWGNK
uniref:Glutathione S-transferase n=1 Tax=Ursus americanus TaxID=9643 RepID=A0A452QGR7_URSAM